MGCHCSKLSWVNNKKHIAELTLTSSYKEACSLMPQLQLSSDTLPRLKEPVLNNSSLLFLATDFLKTAVSTMKLLASLKISLSESRNRRAIILQALNCYEKEEHESFKNYSRTLSKLKEFKEAGDPFARLLADEFALLCQQQQSIVKDLNSKKNEIRQKMRSTKKWKKVWKVMYNAAFVSVLVLSVFLAAMAAPPFATVAVAAGGTAIKTAEQWFDTIWNSRVHALEGEKDVVLVMAKAELGAGELESIRAMWKRLEIKIASIAADAGFAMGRKEEEIAVEMAMEEIKGKIGGMEEWIDRLEGKVDACEGEVRKMVAQFFNVIANE